MPQVAAMSLGERRRQQILEVARRQFCDQGYEGTTVADIADEIGVVEGTVYRYFDSKHTLLLSVLEHWYRQMFGDYAADLASVSDAPARLHLLIWRHLRTIRDFPRLCRLMFREARDAVGPANQQLRQLNRRYTRFLMDVIQSGAEQGQFRSDLDPQMLRDLVYGGIEHYCWRYLWGQGQLDIDTAAEAISGIFCHGICPSTRPPSLQGQTRRLEQLINRMEHLLPPHSPEPA